MKAARTRALNRKHAGTGKHAGTAKHSPSVQKRAATGHGQVARRTVKQVRAAHVRALGGVACCSAEAVAASARLAGWPVADADVLGLYRHTADSPVAGASIWAALEAALAFGLAGVRPLAFSPVIGHGYALGAWPESGHLDVGLDLTGDPGGFFDAIGRETGNCVIDKPDGLIEVHANQRTPLILGLDLPEAPHAVTLDPSGAVWSWGGLYEMTAEAVVEEAWVVTWP